METIKLNNGVEMPALGLGVFQSAPEETTGAVAAALEVGYRHVDTAAVYGNEREVGRALRESGLARSEYFVETKVWINDYGRGATRHAFGKSAGKLGLDVIDLLILHQPFPHRFDLTVEAYRDLEGLLADGSVRAIGVSNFAPEHLERLAAETGVVPAVNQVELHPYFAQPDVQAADAERGIVTQAWSPIGGITFYPGWGGQDRVNVMEDPVLTAIAAEHGRTPAQVMLRWHLQRGRSVIPKSVRPHRIAENFDVFGFALSEAELAAVDGLDRGVRGGPDPAGFTLEEWGSEIPEA
ncbi:aldo/keto reductase [Actinosynnema pretiosum]|uniref:Oxidoreductase n=1 Tax=Actinosynnema pretiosum TaxID=42197 RepID=A0A290ZGX3_9PSEU|nr:aldo/keto reductase [Actinosynnema pretiosum]ATE58268.1 oxidoreductase [Actinosynnema pretiosum]